MAKDTREMITSAFIELAQKEPNRSSFTMTEIAHQAKVSRQAIYQKHFNSVEEIIGYIHKKTDERIFGTYNHYRPETDGSIFEYLADKVLPLVYENREVIRTLYLTKADAGWHEFICKTYSNWALQQLQFDRFHLDKKCLSHLTACMTISIIEMWITQEEPVPPLKFKQTFLDMVATPLQDYVSYNK